MIHILVVEDSRTQAEAARAILETAGYRVDVAGDAQQAIELLSHSPFDLIISDIVMPGLSGYELCRRVKQDPHLARVPVILLTSLSNPMDIIEGLEAGADNFVTKPYDADYLVGRINNLLETKRLRTEEKLTLGIEIVFLGKKFVINSDKEQILDLLITTFEDTVRANQQLREHRQALAQSNAAVDALYTLTDALSRAATDADVLRIALERLSALPVIAGSWISLGQTGGTIGSERCRCEGCGC
jgi:CheY-like chemotaxis protein